MPLTPDTERFALSVMDFMWPGDFPDLVRELDLQGYHRYWATEHHSPRQSGSPTIVAGLAAGLTKRLRVGTAAVLLQYRSPLQVAEEFRLLELLFPGRIDLGLSSALAADPIHGMLLDARPTPTPEGFGARAEELVRLVRGEGHEKDSLDGDAVGPLGASTVPQVWICGMSERSATLAGRLGAAYAFHHYLNQGRVEGPRVIEVYRASFTPHASMPHPRSAVACYGICAETMDEANRLWAFHRGGSQPSGPKPSFLGDPAHCEAQLVDLRRRYNADEIVLQSMIDDIDRRVASYALLADAFALGSVPHASPAQ